MRRACLPLLLSTLLMAAPAIAQNLCQTGIHRLQNHDPVVAQVNLQALLHELFADGGMPDENMQITITLPPALVPDCPEGALEPVADLRRVDDGLYAGRIMPTNISGNGHVFLAQIVFTESEVLEWKPGNHNLGGALEGGVLIGEN